MKLLLKLAIIFFFPVLIFSTFFAAPPISRAQAAGCNYSATYTDGSGTISGTQIVVGKPFSVTVTLGSNGFYHIEATLLANAGGGFQYTQPNPPALTNTVSVTSAEIFSGHPAAVAGDQLIIKVLENLSPAACTPYGSFQNELDLTFVQTANPCKGTLSLSGTTLSATATSCSGQIVIVDLFVTTLKNKTLFNQTLSTNNWSQTFDITNDIQNNDTAIMYETCDQDPYTHPSCIELARSNLVPSQIVPSPSALLVPGVNPCQNNVCQTGLGNIPTTVQDFATTILGIAAGLGGGFALILMVIGAIQVLTSGGDQQKLSQGRERFVAAVSGLLFIIFAVLILQFIGLNILGTIPGF